MPQAKSALFKKPTPNKKQKSAKHHSLSKKKNHKAQYCFFLFNTLLKFELELEKRDEKLKPVLSGKSEYLQ